VMYRHHKTRKPQNPDELVGSLLYYRHFISWRHSVGVLHLRRKWKQAANYSDATFIPCVEFAPGTCNVVVSIFFRGQVWFDAKMMFWSTPH
jgi:hypothetical protein